MNATKLLFSTAAAVTMAGAIGFAYAQTSNTDNSAVTTGSSGMTDSTQTQTTTTGQAPASTWDAQNQQRMDATGSTSTNTPGTSANTSGTSTSGSDANRNMNDGSTSMTNDGTNVRRDNTGTNVGMTNERPARADRN